MTVEELLFWIAVLTGVTTVVQCIEMMILIHNQRETNRLLQNVGHLASDGFFQFVCDIADDKNKEAAFFGFVQKCGAHALGAAKDMVQGATVKMPRIKSLGDVIGTLFQMPGVQAKVEEKAAAMLDGKAKEAVEAAKDLGGF